MRSFLATLAGLAAAVLVTLLMGALGHTLFPPIGDLDPNDPAQLAAYVKAQPLPAKLWLALTWSLAATSGSFIGTRISRGEILPAALVAAFMLFGIGTNAYSIPHPLWLLGLGAAMALFGAATGFQLARGAKTEG